MIASANHVTDFLIYCTKLSNSSHNNQSRITNNA